MIDGKNIWNAVDLLSRVGTEIDALRTELFKKMSESLRGEDGFNVVEGDEEVAHGLGDWVAVALLYQWGLKPTGSGKKSVVGNLSIQIVIWSEDAEIDPCGGIPRVEVAYMSSEKPRESEYGAGTWLVSDDSEWGDWKKWCVSSESKCLMSPKTETAIQGAKWCDEKDWIYAVPLFSVNNNADIDHLIIEPAMKLLRGEAPDKALCHVPAFKFVIGKDGVLQRAPE